MLSFHILQQLQCIHNGPTFALICFPFLISSIGDNLWAFVLCSHLVYHGNLLSTISLVGGLIAKAGISCTVEPVYNDHLGTRYIWPLYTGGCYRENLHKVVCSILVAMTIYK